jgi:DNA-directed RNA polymerase subunit F
MTEFRIIEENPISLDHIKTELEGLDKEDALTFRGEKTKAYLENFVTDKPKDIDPIKEAIKGLEIPRLKARHIIKICDLKPKDLDSLKITLSGETLTINDDDLKRILDVIPQ